MNAPLPHTRGIRAFCDWCPYEGVGTADLSAHIETCHADVAHRWPDGGLVIDTSDAAEQLLHNPN